MPRNIQPSKSHTSRQSCFCFFVDLLGSGTTGLVRLCKEPLEFSTQITRFGFHFQSLSTFQRFSQHFRDALNIEQNVSQQCINSVSTVSQHFTDLPNIFQMCLNSVSAVSQQCLNISKSFSTFVFCTHFYGIL